MMQGFFGQAGVICVGLQRWKARHLAPILSAIFSRVSFVQSAAEAANVLNESHDFIGLWGMQTPHGVQELAHARGCTVLRIEDGFYRSVGLGSDLIRPMSIVLDPMGIHFSPQSPSLLEELLNNSVVSESELEHGRQLRNFIVTHGLTKYNLEDHGIGRWTHDGRRVIFVPGQVEDDASISYGAGGIRTNLALLKTVREAHSDAFIVYKPHPDVTSLNRKGGVSRAQVEEYADHIEMELSVVSCIRASDEVHTITSQSGFDALLHGKRVITYGLPFYAGWGLTDDKAGNEAVQNRRRRRPTVEELVVIALLRYPVYFDWNTRSVSDCESVLTALLKSRTELERSGALQKLRTGIARRQIRKGGALLRASIGPAR